MNEFHIFDKFNKISSIEFIVKYDVFLNIELTHNCNFSCSYCYDNTNRTNKKFIDKNDIFILLEMFNTLNKKVHIDILGGEPTLHLEIKEIIKKLNDFKCIHKIRLTSNGSYNDYIGLLSSSSKDIILHISYHPSNKSKIDYKALFETLNTNIEFSCAFMLDNKVPLNKLHNDLKELSICKNLKIHPLYFVNYDEEYLEFFNKYKSKFKRYLKLNGEYFTLEEEFFNSYHNPFFDSSCNALSKRFLLDVDGVLIASCDNDIRFNTKVPSMKKLVNMLNILSSDKCKNNNCNCWLNYARTIDEKNNI